VISSRSNQPKVLVITPRFPYPVVGGDRLRIYEVCKELSKYCSLTLLSLCETKGERDFDIPDDGVFERVERHYLPPFRSYWNAMLSILSDKPLQVAYYWDSRFRASVERAAVNHDVCIAHLVRTSEYLRHVDKPKILEMTDAISLNYDRVKSERNNRAFRSQIYSFESDRLRRYEVDVSHAFDASFVVSDVDRMTLLGNGASQNIFVASNGVDAFKYTYKDRRSNAKVIVFIGNMFSHQNLDAVRYFARDVMPLLMEKGDFVFRVIGRIRMRHIEELKSFGCVEVRANVPDVSEAVGDAPVAVAPIRLGAGVQNKVLEYMALGIATVVSPIALEGFNVEPGKHLLVAKTAREYAEHVENLIFDENMRLGIAQEARKFVECNQSWPVQLAPLTRAVFNLAENKS